MPYSVPGESTRSRVARAFWRYLALAFLKIGYLPSGDWYRAAVLRGLFRPIHPRDEGSGLTGYVALGAASLAEVDRFQRWWEDHG